MLSTLEGAETTDVISSNIHINQSVVEFEILFNWDDVLSDQRKYIFRVRWDAPSEWKMYLKSIRLLTKWRVDSIVRNYTFKYRYSRYWIELIQLVRVIDARAISNYFNVRHCSTQSGRTKSFRYIVMAIPESAFIF